ncbi:MAG: twin-arginine translocase subunit TatC [Candidatus Binataceae bacterium]
MASENITSPAPLPAVQPGPVEGAPASPADASEAPHRNRSEMPLLEHLTELRIRLIRALIAVGLGFIIAYAFADELFRALTWPIRDVSGGKVLLIGTGVGEAFFTKIKVALIAGLFLASPAVFYEIWRFIAPGLHAAERKMAKPFVFFASLFFMLGGYFCWAVVFKVGYAFFLSEYASLGVTPTIRISEYLAFSAKLLLAFAITFEMPIFAFFFTKLGMIDYKMMLRFWRYAILAIFIVAAALTPPDMVSQFLLAIPLLLLYGISIGVAYVFRMKPAGEAAAASSESGAA